MQVQLLVNHADILRMARGLTPEVDRVRVQIPAKTGTTQESTMATTLTIHHTTAKKAREAGIVLTVDETANVAVASMAEKILAKGEEGQNPREVLERALEVIEENGGEDFDIEEFESEYGSEGEDEEGDESGSIVKPEYRERYREFGGDNCGDPFAVAWRDAVHVPMTRKDGSERKNKHGGTVTEPDHEKARAVLSANGINVDEINGRNFGHRVMIGMNLLRGKYNRGEAVTIGSTEFKAGTSAKFLERQAAAKAKKDAKDAAAQAKAKAAEDKAKKDADEAQAKVTAAIEKPARKARGKAKETVAQAA